MYNYTCISQVSFFLFFLLPFFVFSGFFQFIAGYVAGPMAFAEKMVLAVFGVGLSNFNKCLNDWSLVSVVVFSFGWCRCL